MQTFWKRTPPPNRSPRIDLSEQERRWAQEEEARAQKLTRLMKELEQFPDFASVLAEPLRKDGARHD